MVRKGVADTTLTSKPVGVMTSTAERQTETKSKRFSHAFHTQNKGGKNKS